MATAGDTLTLLLPERRRFAIDTISPAIGKLLGRADRLADAEPGERAQLARYFEISPCPWPMAAMLREAEANDAADHAWLRADPVHVRPDMGGARLLAWGNLGLKAVESESLLEQLLPLFDTAGFPISNTTPEHWYLQLPRAAPLPEFSTPEQGMGEDVFRHLPDGPEGKRWRALLNEAQVILHNHPVNARRAAAGRLSANSLWFWGAGALPRAVNCQAQAIIGADDELLALAKQARIATAMPEQGNVLIDLRRERDWPGIEREYLGVASRARCARYNSIVLDFADGARWRIAPGQGWRFWRRSLERLLA